MGKFDYTNDLSIIGAGPAGLVAAITAAKAGLNVILYEKRTDVGLRFNDDFQGLENWSMPMDIVDELNNISIETNFEHTACHGITCYDACGHEYYWQSETPFYYLVRRGNQEGSLDSALKAQAIAAGVNFQFQNTLEHLSTGGIVCLGPRAPDAIAIGYLFDTDLEDAAYAVFDDRLAIKGYAYLLIHNHRATLATCLFEDFHHEQQYLERTVNYFQDKLNFTMSNPHRFGGVANYVLPRTAVKGKVLYAGECAGFQDPLWGFGIRYALLSGYLAAKVFIEKSPLEKYDQLWRKRFGGHLKTAAVNRYLYNMLGNKGYHRVLNRIDSAPSVRDWLYGLYAPSLFKKWFYLWVKNRLRFKRDENYAANKNCDCTWCRCLHHNTR